MLCCNPAIYSYLVEWCLVSYVFCFMSVSVCQKVPLLWQDHGPQPHPPGEQGSGGRGLIWAISCKQRYSWTTLYFNTVPVISSNLHKNECTMPLQGEQDLSHIPRPKRVNLVEIPSPCIICSIPGPESKTKTNKIAHKNIVQQDT